MRLHEEYRPKEWDGVVGQTLTALDQLRPRGLGGRAFWIAGPSGTGKTTIARLIAAEVAEGWATDEFDGGDLSVDRLREMERSLVSRPLGGKGWAWIINEAHNFYRKIKKRIYFRQVTF